MSTTLTMSFNEFFEMKRGNRTLKQILKNNNNSNNIINNLEFYLNAFLLIIACSIPLQVQVPTEQANIEVTKESIKVLYVIATVGLECVYDMMISVASCL